MLRFIILLVSIFGIISCSDSSTGPESYEPSKFFPLMSGAQWDYSYLYSADSRANSSGGVMIHNEYGYLNLSVQEVLSDGMFLVNVHFSIDSLYHNYYSDGYVISPGDTAYMSYAIYDTSFTCIFTADKEHVSYNYFGAEKLLYGYDNGAYQDIDLSLFNLGRFEFFDLPMKYQGVMTSNLVYRHWGDTVTFGYNDWNTAASFDQSSGGLVHVGYNACTNCGMISHRNATIGFDLIDFNPGGTEL